ncbi:hypothetical protein JAO29_02470 [Edaphobacter sp. HDX4]
MSGQATIDAGLKSFATNGPLPKVGAGAPTGTTYALFGDEPRLLTFPEVACQLPVGSVVKFEKPHCDPTVNLHDYLHVAQEDTLMTFGESMGAEFSRRSPRNFNSKT